MEYLQQEFSVRFGYKVFFTEHLVDPANKTLHQFLQSVSTDTARKLFFVVDSSVDQKHPQLRARISNYLKDVIGWTFIPELMIIPGGEHAKNEEKYFYNLIDA